MRRKQSDISQLSPLFEELEPRLLFSADGAEVFAAPVQEQELHEELVVTAEPEIDIAAPSVDQPTGNEISEPLPDTSTVSTNDSSVAPASQEVSVEDAVTTPIENQTNPTNSETLSTEDSPAEPVDGDVDSEDSSDPILDRKGDIETIINGISDEADVGPDELILINENVKDANQLIDDIEGHDTNKGKIEVIVLDDSRDGLQQVTEILAEHQDLDAIHFITHGSAGRLAIGNNWLDTDDLNVNYETVSGWGDSLAEEGDILLYGCSIAIGEDGQDFVDILAQITDADVVASVDQTGNAGMGGDWALEYSTGTIEAPVTVSLEGQQLWDHLLNETIEDNFDTISFSGSNGTLAWSTDWQEINDNDDGAGDGNVEVFDQYDFGRGLELWRSHVGAWREADLTGATSATLSFDWGLIRTDSGDSVTLEISTDGGNNWALIDSYDGLADDSDLHTASYDISAYVSGNTRIKFATTTFGDNDEFFVDNIKINLENGFAATSEFLVNTLTDSTQETTAATRGSEHAVAMDANGNYVVVWSDSVSDGSGYGIFGQRFDRTGTALGSEFRVNETTTDNQYWARVAMDATGNYVTTWTSVNQDGTPSSIYARRFNADGTPAAGEFRVNTEDSGSQSNSSIGMDDSGNFTIVWQGNGPTSDSNGIYFRRFNADGSAIDATDRLANQIDNGNEQNSVIAMQTAGKFVIGWHEGTDIFFQRFDSSGSVLGAETKVNGKGGLPTSTSDFSVDSDSSGNFTFVCRENTSFVSGVYQRAFNADGTAKYDYSHIVYGDAVSPSIAMTDDGSFLVVYEKTGDGDGLGVYGQKINTAGEEDGSAFLINETTTGTQHMVSAAMLDIDNYVAVWSGNGVGDGSGVFARQFASGNTAPVLNAGPLALNSVNEDTGPPAGTVGTLISDLVDLQGGGGHDNVTDPDTDAVTGIALRNVKTGHGSWYFTIDNGTHWNFCDSVNNTNVLLLSADASTRIFFRPDTNFNGTIANAIKFYAWDQTTGTNGEFVDPDAFGGTSAFSLHLEGTAITVTALNDAPTVANPISDQVATEDSSFSFQFAADTFNDIDGDTLTYTSDASGWLSFDAATRTFSGIPLNGDVGTTTVTVTAGDGHGGIISDSFDIVVSNTNDAPTITSTATTTATEDSPYSYTFTVNDVDVGDTLTLSAPTLPEWLSFDLGTGVLSGTPTNADFGDHAVVLRVNDGTVDVDQTFTITVANNNDSPTVANPISDQVATEDSSFSFQFAADTFNDIDGDILTYTSDAPGWLSFDAATRTFSGIPLNGDVGTTTVTVTAGDGHGGTISDSFNIVVTNTNDAPTTTPVTLTAMVEDSGTRTIHQAELLSNANDVDGDALTAIGLVISSGAGTLVDNGDGIWDYTPVPDDDTAVSFSYTISDGNDTVAGSAMLDITPVNDTPTAVEDGMSTQENTPVTTGDVLANDDPGDGLVGITGFDSVSVRGGAIIYNNDGTFSYSPVANFTGTDTFTYSITDIDGESSTASVTVVVIPIQVQPPQTGGPVEAEHGPSEPVRETDQAANGEGTPAPEEDGTPQGDASEAEPVPVVDNVPDDTSSSMETPEKTPVESSTNQDKDKNEPAVSDVSQAAPKQIITGFTEQGTNTLTTAGITTNMSDEIATAGEIQKKIFFSHSIKQHQETTTTSTSILLEKYLDRLRLDNEMQYTQAFEQLQDALDKFREEVKNETQYYKTVVGSAIAVSTGLSVGYVVWLIRGGMLMSSVLFSMPAWQIADPLPLLSNPKNDDDKDDESLESIIRDGSSRESKERTGRS